MSMQFRSIESKSRVRTIQESTRLLEHRCSSKCLGEEPKLKPTNLKRISLGYIYDSDEGFVIEWGDNDWLPVVGLTFCRTTDGRLIKMFEPAVQLHIHSPGGRTIAKVTKSKGIRLDESFYAEEASKRLKQKGFKLRAARDYLGTVAAKSIPRAVSKKKLKGTGKGAPGKPRSEFSKSVVSLFEARRSEEDAVETMINWSRERGLPVAGPYKRSIQKRVNRWYSRLKNRTHK